MIESRGLRLGQEKKKKKVRTGSFCRLEEKERRDSGEEPPTPHTPSSSSGTCQSPGGRGA